MFELHIGLNFESFSSANFLLLNSWTLKFIASNLFASFIVPHVKPDFRNLTNYFITSFELNRLLIRPRFKHSGVTRRAAEGFWFCQEISELKH